MAMSARNASQVSVCSVRGKLSEEKLRGLIDVDRVTGCIVVSRNNKINRAHYANLLGCTPAALARFKHVFAKYERELDIVTGPMRHLSAMREWLTAAYTTGELKIRDGKVDRAMCFATFGLHGNTAITRHPCIRALFEEFDARAERESYLPQERQAELQRVLVALAGQPILNKDRKTINRVELAKATCVPLTRFVERPFADAIAAHEAEILEQVATSTIDPFLFGRVFAFGELIAVWSMRFTERVAVRFKQIASGYAKETAKFPYLQLIKMLNWVGASSNPHCRVVVAEANELGRVLSADDWEEALFAYRDHVIAGIGTSNASKGAVDHALGALRPMLNGLSSGAIVPSSSTPLPGVKHVAQRSSRKRSIAEAPTTSAGEIDYVGFARTSYLEACRCSGTDLGSGESDEFISSIAFEIARASDLPVNPVAAIRLILERRLVALHSHAKAIVDTAIEAYERGRELLSLSKIDGANFEQAYLGDTLSLNGRSQLVHALFPPANDSAEGQAEQGIANFLGLIEQRFGGIPPLGHDNSNNDSYGQFFAKRYLDYGGLRSIAPMLNPGPDTIGAVLTLYLVESGANVSVGRTLNRECIQTSDLDGYRRITGHKARARGKPIYIDLPETSSAVCAMTWLLSASGRLQATANKDSDRLFLMRIGRSVELMTPHWYTNWFKKFASSSPGLEDIALVPSMIRPSVLLLAALSNDGRLATGMAIGQHGVTVTQGYQQKWPTRLLYDENIRRFQAAFETIVMSGVADAAARLGITTDQFAARLGNLRETGLGTFCKDQRGRPGEQHATCSTLDCWNDCPNLLIVAEVEAVAALQLWQRSLREAQPEWERDRPERWDQFWLPWLCLTDVVEEKMVRGPLIKIWMSAQRRAAEIFAQPSYAPPLPW
jgi:hypothetical protein